MMRLSPCSSRPALRCMAHGTITQSTPSRWGLWRTSCEAQWCGRVLTVTFGDIATQLQNARAVVHHRVARALLSLHGS